MRIRRRQQHKSRFMRDRGSRVRPLRVSFATLADIAFLLMIFFLTSTVLRLEEGLHVELPRARTALSQPRDRIAHVWIDAEGQLMVNDLFVGYDDLAPILARKLRDNPHLIVALNTDRRTRYQYMHQALAELKKAEAVRVSFTTVPRGAGS